MASGKIFKWPGLFSSSDEETMWRVRTEDDHQAFAELMQRWEKPIQSLATRMMGDWHRGQDLAQETFARLFAKRASYEPSGRFSTFLWRMALNLCYDELRRNKRRHESALEVLDDRADDPGLLACEPAPDTALVRNERIDTIRRALLQLSEPYRVVVVLRHYEGLRFGEIGEILNIPEGTVKSRMAEALQQLHRILQTGSKSARPRPNLRKEHLLI